MGLFINILIKSAGEVIDEPIVKFACKFVLSFAMYKLCLFMNKASILCFSLARI